MKICLSTVLAAAASLALAAGALAGPVTVTGGALDVRAYDGAVAFNSLAATQTMNTSDSVTNGASNAHNSYQFTHGGTWSNFAIQMTQSHGAAPFAHARSSASIIFTVAVPMTYEITGNYTVGLTSLSQLQSALIENGGSTKYDEVDWADNAAGSHVLNNVGTQSFSGARTGTIGPGTYTVYLDALMQAVATPATGSTVRGAGVFNVRFEDAPPAIPLPTGAAMAVAGLGVVGLRRRRC